MYLTIIKTKQNFNFFISFGLIKIKIKLFVSIINPDSSKLDVDSHSIVSVNLNLMDSVFCLFKHHNSSNFPSHPLIPFSNSFST